MERSGSFLRIPQHLRNPRPLLSEPPDKFPQMLRQASVLPLTFPRNSGGIGSLRAVPGGTDRVARDVWRRRGLTCGPGGEPCGAPLFGFAGGGVGVKGTFANGSHAELAGPHPSAAGFYRVVRATVLRVCFLEKVKDVGGAVGGPDGEGSVVFFGDPVIHSGVHIPVESGTALVILRALGVRPGGHEGHKDTTKGGLIPQTPAPRRTGVCNGSVF